MRQLLTAVPASPKSPLLQLSRRWAKTTPRHQIPQSPNLGCGAIRPKLPLPTEEEISHNHLYRKSLWIIVNLKGCQARYRWMIWVLASFVQWSHHSAKHCPNIGWISISGDNSFNCLQNCQTFFICCAVFSLALWQLTTDVYLSRIPSPANTKRPPALREKLGLWSMVIPREFILPSQMEFKASLALLCQWTRSDSHFRVRLVRGLDSSAKFMMNPFSSKNHLTASALWACVRWSSRRNGGNGPQPIFVFHQAHQRNRICLPLHFQAVYFCGSTPGRMC